MTADEIEFLEPDAPQPDGDWHTEEMGGEPRTRPPLAVDRRSAAAVMLLAGAAALSAVAPFQGVYTFRERGAGTANQTYGADGWGRYRQDGGPLSDTPSGIHDVRFGIALVACAGLSALLAVAVVATMLPGRLQRMEPRARLVLAAAALAVSALLGGVAAAIALHLQSLFDSVHAQFDSIGEVGFGHQPSIDTGIGACLWLALAGVVCGLLATVALATRRAPDDA